MPNELPDKPETTPAPETTPPETPSPEKVEDKVEDKGKQAYEELQKVLGRQGHELGQLRQEKAQLEGIVQQILATQASQRPAQPEPQVPGRFDFDNPDKSVDARIDAKMKTELEKQLGQLYRAVTIRQAKATAPMAKQLAMAQAPHLYQDGMEKEVENFMDNAIRQGVDPAIMENPEMWKLIAYNLRGAREGYGSGGRVNPVAPISGDRPAQAKSRDIEGEEPITLEREHEDAIKAFGLDPVKFKQELAKEKKGRK